MKSEWKACTIGELCDSVSVTYRGEDERVVLVNTSDVLNGKVLNHTDEPNQNLKGQFKKTFKRNDILYSEIRPANRRFAYIDFDETEKYIASTKLMVIRYRENVVEPKFLYFLLTSNDVIGELQRLAETRSGTFPQITFPAEVATLPVNLPPLPIQQKLASILSALDDKIETNNAICRNLEEQAMALYKSWFVDFEPFGWQKPCDWKEKDIYSVCEIIYGAPFSSKLFNQEKKGLPLIRIRDLNKQESDVYTDEIHPKAYIIHAGDIVVGMDGEFSPYIWGGDAGFLNQRVCVFKNKREKGSFFLYFSIKPQLEYIEQTEMATTVIHIGKKDFDAFSIFLPSEKILDSFDDITFPFYEEIIQRRKENRRLTSIRESLLPRLMSGELTVKEIN